MIKSWTPVLAELTLLEHEVVAAARRGAWATRDGDRVEELALAEDPDLCVRAELIRELLMGRHGELDPRGVRVRGLRLVGLLDLDHVSAVAPLTLVSSALPDGLRCHRACLPEADLSRSWLSCLLAEGLRVQGNLLLEDVVVRGTGDDGAVRLVDAHVDGRLDFDGAYIDNHTGPALNADRVRIGAKLSMTGVTVRGAGEVGAVRLFGAHIGGQLDFARARIDNDSGPALSAEGLRTDGHLFLRDVNVHGAGESGAVRLLGAHVGGQAHLTGTRADNDSGPLLVLSEMQVERVLYLPAAVICPREQVDAGRRACADEARRIAVRGLVFTCLGHLSWQQWLHLVVHHTREYLPQPFQQLAAVERAAGHDDNARQVLITQQEDLRRRAPDAFGGRMARLRHRLWGWLGRYGYRAHRLVTALVVVLALTGAVAYAAGQVPTRAGHHAAERVTIAAGGSSGTRCSTAELVGLGIDRGLPLGTSGLRVRCDLDTSTRRGQVFTYVLWALQALLWALATLAVAAYTGLVRKPT
ncbi:hypothetical protein ACFV4N_15420 [Actinosynnema sp. NPDC059797]